MFSSDFSFYIIPGSFSHGNERDAQVTEGENKYSKTYPNRSRSGEKRNKTLLAVSSERIGRKPECYTRLISNIII